MCKHKQQSHPKSASAGLVQWVCGEKELKNKKQVNLLKRNSNLVNPNPHWDHTVDSCRPLKFTAALQHVVMSSCESGPEFYIVLVSVGTQRQTGSILLQILTIAIEHRPRWRFTIEQQSTSPLSTFC